MFTRIEAVFSSQIEGKEVSLEDLLKSEAQASSRGPRDDLADVVNYVEAVSYGLDSLRHLPVSLLLLREIQGRLMKGVGERESNFGEFRRSQNCVGPPGCSLNEASYVPPPVQAMNRALGDLERFLDEKWETPSLIRYGLVHSQFETIHPFTDGNGRVGRLLITLLLFQDAILQEPLLYLSYYFKKRQVEYYERLQAVRDEGDWEGWLKFFLRGVLEVSLHAADTVKRIFSMRAEHLNLIKENLRTANALRLYERLSERPIISVPAAATFLGITFNGANRLLRRLKEVGLLKEMSGKQRNRLFAYEPYLRLLRGGLDP